MHVILGPYLNIRLQELMTFSSSTTAGCWKTAKKTEYQMHEYVNIHVVSMMAIFSANHDTCMY